VENGEGAGKREFMRKGKSKKNSENLPSTEEQLGRLVKARDRAKKALAVEAEGLPRQQLKKLK